MTNKKSLLLLLLSVMIVVSLSGCWAAQRVTPLPSLPPTSSPSPTPLRPTVTPMREPTLTLVTPTTTSTPAQTPTLVSLTSTPTPEPMASLVPPTLTPTPAPAVERILFAPETTQVTIEDYLPPNDTKVYVMGVAAGQLIEMSATVGAMGQGLRFSIVGSDGTVVRAMGEAYVRAVVPRTQDYYVELASDVGAVNYRMSVLIPVRVRFAPGTTSAEVAGRLAANDMRHYVLRALAGQKMIIVPRATRGQVGLVISGADGQVLLSGRVAGDDYDGILPATQDYLITVQGLGETSAEYTLEITILPL